MVRSYLKAVKILLFNFEVEEEDDEDEVLLYKKKLLKSLSHFKVKENCILQVNGHFTQKPEEDEIIYLQVNQNEEIESDYNIKLLKQGVKVKVNVSFYTEIKAARCKINSVYLD